MSEATICTVATCNRPSDGWFACATCSEIFETQVLAEIGWILDDLDLVISGQVKYAPQVGGKSSEARLPVNLTASDAKGRLLTELDTAARMIADANGIAAEYRDGQTAAAWLAYRISMIRLHPAGGQIIEDVTREFTGALWLCDRPKQRQYLGDCKDHERADDLPECPGAIYGIDGKPEARCDVCGAWWDKDQLKQWLLGILDDKIMTAAEIAHMSVYLGMNASRERVRKLMNQWHKRGQIAPWSLQVDHRSVVGFRFGDALTKLAELEAKRAAG